MSMGIIRERAERMWQGDVGGGPGRPLHEVLDRGEEVADSLFVYSGIASTQVFDSGDGLVMLDTGSQREADSIFSSLRAWRPDAPVSAAVFSHHHIDHVGGLSPFEVEAAARGWPRPTVYAHRDVPKNFDRYKKTAGWNRAITVRQFAREVRGFSWPAVSRYPDVTYDDDWTFRRGGLTFELHHARGETDDATWTWVPEMKLVHAGDLFIWALPNAGNPQKVQRYPGDWAAALHEMRVLRPEVLLPGHGLPIFGRERVAQALLDTADLLESLEAQTVALMNAGISLDQLLREVAVPEKLSDLPYLRAIYDDSRFVVRNIWRLYGGWHDGQPDNLLPAARADQAHLWVHLAGGVEKVLAEATRLKESGELALACHAIEFAVLVEPDLERAHVLRAEIYEARAAAEGSSMARNILLHAALASRQGKRDLAGDW